MVGAVAIYRLSNQLSNLSETSAKKRAHAKSDVIDAHREQGAWADGVLSLVCAQGPQARVLQGARRPGRLVVLRHGPRRVVAALPTQTRDVQAVSNAASRTPRVPTGALNGGRNFQTVPRSMRCQRIVSALMAYATYITVVCPCKKTLSCHLPHFFGAVGLSALLVARENGAFS